MLKPHEQSHYIGYKSQESYRSIRLVINALKVRIPAVFSKQNSTYFPGNQHFNHVLNELLTKDTNEYRLEKCKLDLYYPMNSKGFATVVWFHGGGLESGDKNIPLELKNKGICVVSVNYRLYPQAKKPAYMDDAAAAVAWVFNNIEQYGGDKTKIDVAGHSAGGYLTLMIGLDKSYLAKYSIDADRIKGLMPVSGQTNTHWAIKKELGMDIYTPYVDHFAPIFHARKNAPETLLIVGDRKLEILARYEENLHLETMLKYYGTKVTLYELQGFDHGTVVSPACNLIISHMKK